LDYANSNALLFQPAIDQVVISWSCNGGFDRNVTWKCL